jgi:hypothetical protein
MNKLQSNNSVFDCNCIYYIVVCTINDNVWIVYEGIFE